MYVLTPKSVANQLVRIPGRGEFGLPQTLLNGGAGIPITAVLGTSWISITSPEDIAKAESLLGP